MIFGRFLGDKVPKKVTTTKGTFGKVMVFRLLLYEKEETTTCNWPKFLDSHFGFYDMYFSFIYEIFLMQRVVFS